MKIYIFPDISLDIFDNIGMLRFNNTNKSITKNISHTIHMRMRLNSE